MNSTGTNSRLIRWVLRLQKFNFVVEYRKGKLNEAPDALSRIHSVPGCHVYSTQKEEPGLPVSAIDIWEEQHKDPEITKLFRSLAGKDSSVHDQYEIIEDKLYRWTHLANGQVHYRIYVPATIIPNILQHYHAQPLRYFGYSPKWRYGRGDELLNKVFFFFCAQKLLL